MMDRMEPDADKPESERPAPPAQARGSVEDGASLRTGGGWVQTGPSELGARAPGQDVPKWVYKLFTGLAYPYVRRQAKFAKEVTPGEDRPEPTPAEIEAKFWEVYPNCWVKVLQEIKTGMIVAFIELGRYEPGTYQELIENPERFLAEQYGKKKIKLNFYLGENFVCTQNFKVAGWISHEDGNEQGMGEMPKESHGGA